MEALLDLGYAKDMDGDPSLPPMIGYEMFLKGYHAQPMLKTISQGLGLVCGHSQKCMIAWPFYKCRDK